MHRPAPDYAGRLPGLPKCGVTNTRGLCQNGLATFSSIVAPGQAGSGSGGHSALFAKYGAIVTSADITLVRAVSTQNKFRLLGELAGGCQAIQSDAEHLPFNDNSFDIVTIAFGLRNVTDKPAALRSMLRVLKPGGRLLILEFSKPTTATLNQLYDFYSFNILPKMGQLVANDADSYQYLAESIRMHPDQETLKQMMSEAGYENVDYQNLTGGIVALHRGYKF